MMRFPPASRIFRLALTLIAAFFMGVMVLVRQRLLDRELTQLLHHSRESVDSLNHLQAQILQSEKLASIGQLVGGAAHELNNPITAMLGYSDMLLSTRLTPGAAATGGEDWPICSSHEIAGRQSDQLCPAVTGAQESYRPQHSGPHRD